MKRVIRLGDPHTHGGNVITAALTTEINGKRVARRGDKAVCPKKGHGVVTIVEGDPSWSVDGQPVALEGHKCSCGCSLISTLPTLERSYEGTGDTGSGNSVKASAIEPTPAGLGSEKEFDQYNELFVLVDENGKPVPNFRYKVLLANGNEIRGVTDSEGKSKRIGTGYGPMGMTFHKHT